jgi:peptide/nickel transport system ATP-binding protein
VNPPSGCRFHTRCPEAREVCTRETPAVDSDGPGGDHATACFRTASSDHEYWSSPPLEGTRATSIDDPESPDAGRRGGVSNDD